VTNISRTPQVQLPTEQEMLHRASNPKSAPSVSATTHQMAVEKLRDERSEKLKDIAGLNLGEHVSEGIAQINERLSAHGSNAHISYDHDAKRLVLQIRDPVYGDVIFQLPSQDSIELGKRLEALTGIVLNKSE